MAVTESVVQPTEKWFETDDYSYALPFGDQKGGMRLNVSFELYPYRRNPDAPVERFLLASLEGSTVTPAVDGKLTRNQRDIRGWFTEAVDVEMVCGGEKVTIRQDAPPTTEETGSHTVSSSISVSFNEGAFGKTPTAGAGVGFSISNSFTENLSDFRIINKSTSSKVSHGLALTMLKGGHRYRWLADLVSDEVSGALLELPDRAISNLSLVSQALFHAPPQVNGTEKFVVSLTHHLAWLEKTFYFLDVVKKDPHQEARVKVWTFDIPFGAVG
jgi:hypothetical protein